MLTHALLTVVALTAGLTSQKGRPVHVFAYDPAAYEVFLASQQKKTVPEGAEPASPEIKVAKKSADRPPSYVYISGNFGGVFYVSGVGGSASQTQSNVIVITTNRALTFSANSFKPLQLGNSSESSMGTVTYSMAMYQGSSSHVGALISGPVSGTDSGFNGQTLVVNSAQIPTGGNLVLVLTRTLNVTGQATGACTLVGTGYIGVTIN